MSNMLLCTTDQVPGHRVVAVFGLVRGLTVRSRSMFGDVLAGMEATLGGRQSVMIELCEEARSEATRLLMDRAAELGANAVLAMRYDTNDVAPGVTEVLAYGTAVCIEPVEGDRHPVRVSYVAEESQHHEEYSDRGAEEEACLECGKPIPASAKACPHCGWTWL